MRNILGVFILSILLFSCGEDNKPKPKGFLALQYPEAHYKRVDIGCPYIFDMNTLAEMGPSRNNVPCWIDLNYDLLNASIFLTYMPVNNNLDSLLTDAQKLPLRHTIKADEIEGDIYTNKIHDTYGMFYEVSGDAASQAQFYLTDSTDHFITGSVYFNAVPNFDSIIPAADYLKRDMRHLMESLRWKEKK